MPSIRSTYETAYPAFKNGEKDPSRKVSHRSMGRPTTKAEMEARDLLEVNDDWPTRRSRFRSTVKRLATVARRNDSKRILRNAEAELQITAAIL